MDKLLGFFGASPARLQALLIGALVMALTCASLAGWALWERSERFQAERDAATFKAQSAVLASSLATCNGSIGNLAGIGKAIQGQVHDALAGLAKANAPIKRQIEEIAAIVQRPPPTRPDGKPSDCADAWREIEARARP